MQFSEGRRDFFRNFLPRDSLDSGSYKLVEILNRNVDRREAIALGAGIAGGLMLEPYVAQASGRPSELIGTNASLAEQVRMFTKDDLSMLYDRHLQEGSKMRTSKRLVKLPESSHYSLNGNGNGRDITRPYVSLCLQNLADDYFKNFGTPLPVSSLTRSYEYQKKLREENQNATLPEKSPHVRGAAFDISYLRMNEKQKEWMRRHLVDFERLGVVEATEELEQNAFHAMVFKSYARHSQKNTGMDNAQFARYFERRTGGKEY